MTKLHVLMNFHEHKTWTSEKVQSAFTVHASENLLKGRLKVHAVDELSCNCVTVFLA